MGAIGGGQDGDWHLVSDVHLGLPGSERDAAAFARFLSAVDQRRTETRTDLVLLGDVFELYPDLGVSAEDVVTPASARARLDAVLGGQAEVLQALAQLVRSGVGVRIVPGNHDLDLHRPELQERLMEELGAGGGAGVGEVTFHPWIYWVPGVLHAEHGHRYHDINVVPADPLCADGAIVLPAATRAALDPRPFAVAVLDALRRDGRPWLRRRPQLTADRAAKLGREIGVEGAVVQDLDALASPTVASTVARLAVTAARGPGTAGDYLQRQAPDIAAAFRDGGPVVHAFGHTHRAACTLLAGGSVYANCGTWTGEFFSGEADPADRWYTSLRVSCRGGEVDVALLEWLDQSGSERTVRSAAVGSASASPR